jgi:hypothetical protein
VMRQRIGQVQALQGPGNREYFGNSFRNGRS